MDSWEHENIPKYQHERISTHIHTECVLKIPKANLGNLEI